MSQEPFSARMYPKTAGSQDCDVQFVRASAVEVNMDMSQELFMKEFTGQMMSVNIGSRVLYEPAQSKRTWTCRKKSPHQRPEREP